MKVITHPLGYHCADIDCMMAPEAASPLDQRGVHLTAVHTSTCTALPSKFLEVSLVLEGGALGTGTSLKVYLTCSLETVPALCLALLETDEKKFHRDSKSISVLKGITS